MSARSVVVLCPNGRRQQLKVTTNSTNLQILEDVCTKQGLNSEQFDLKHYNKVLDLTSTVQFSNLPNNAQLELVEVTKPRKEQAVSIALQLEDGQRFIDSFPSSSTLWEVIVRFQLDDWSDEDKIPACVYMRREISGKEQLFNTTLRSLGLVSGSAVIRLIFKRAAQDSTPNVQADTAVTRLPVELPVEKERDILARPGSSKENKIYVPERKSPSPPKVEKLQSMETDDPTVDDNSNFSGLMSLSAADIDLQLDKRKAFIFSLDDIEHIPTLDELPEGFFDLTVEDVRLLMADLKRQRLELENRALQTTDMRAAQIRRKTERYPDTVIRVFFPDRLVLQGNFKATETVADVMSFVRHFLRDQAINFYLYTTPPKRKLVPQFQLVTASLVPGANVYFGSEGELASLRPEMYDRLTSPTDANRAALPRIQSNIVDVQSSVMDFTTDEPPIQQPSATTDPEPTISNNLRTSNTVPPKWLKLGKK